MLKRYIYEITSVALNNHVQTEKMRYLPLPHSNAQHLPGVRKGSVDSTECICACVHAGMNGSLCFSFIFSLRDLGQTNKTKCVVADSLEFYLGALCWYPSKSDVETQHLVLHMCGMLGGIFFLWCWIWQLEP